MSFGSRLSSLLRRAAHSPQMRRSLRRAGSSIIDAAQEKLGDQSAPSPQGVGSPRDASGPTGDGSGAALADRTTDRPAAISYAPHPDGDPDPGEVVWGWVPFEEDLSQGKDRPVLVLSEEDAAIGGPDGSGRVLIALMLTSRDRADADEVVTDRHGATWVDVGTGGWDRQGRASEVRVDRLLRLPAGAVRREGGRLPQQRFDRVVQLVRETHGWAD
ncbi:MAG TPA: type II toxin-antitoxin system PemK/MazF family toxin [Candidatus Brachybacterium merdigallinarum]|nr:type II toxin-antitoxin system PemK/MazF family toxin [Candidatus Brachybacterium merdigallinarum]